MTPQEIVDKLISQIDQPEFDNLLAELRSHLTMDVIREFAQLSYETSINDPYEGLHIAQLSAQVAEFMGTEEAVALSQWNQGNAYIPLNQYQEALKFFHQAEIYYEKIEKRQQVAGLQINQVLIYRDLGEYQQALRLAEKARKTCQAIDNDTAEIYLANLESSMGWVYQELGKFNKGIESYKHSRELYIKHDDPRVANVDMDLATLYETMDRFVEAEELLQKALHAFIENENTINIPRTYYNLGRVSFRRGQYQLALEYLEKATIDYSAIPLPVEVAVVSLFRLQVYIQLHLFKEIISLSNEIISIFRQNGLQREWIQCLYYQAIAYERLGLWETAVTLLAKVRRLVYQQSAWRELWAIDTERAELLYRLGQTAKARRIARRVQNKVDVHQSPAIVARLNILLGQCALMQHPPNIDQAIQYSEATLPIVTKYHLPEAEIHCRQLLANAYSLAGKPELAWEMQQQAVQACEYIRTNLLLDEFQLGYMEDKLPVYESAIRIAHKRVQAGKLATDDLLNFLNIAQKAPLLVDHELQWRREDENQRFNQALTALRQNWHWHYQKLNSTNEIEENSQWLDLDEIQQKLSQIELEISELRRREVARRGDASANTLAAHSVDEQDLLVSTKAQLQPNEALLHYYEVEEQLQTLIVTKDQFFFVHDLIPIHTLRQYLKAWQFFVAHLQETQGIQEGDHKLSKAHLSRLYRAIWGSIEPYLDDIEHVYLVLPATLQTLPISALFNGEHYVIEERRLTYLSYVGGLLRLNESDEINSKDNANSVAAIFGYSNQETIAYAILEAQKVSQTLAQNWQTQLFLEARATQEEMIAASQNAQLLHLATHGVFHEDNPLFSWLAFADGQMTVADLYELRLRKRPFVVLSGCETGRGKPHGGGLLGMGRGLLAAGASGLLLPLWPIEDQHSAQLMAQFYGQLSEKPFQLDNRQISAALQQAQLAMLSAGLSPYYWSSYIYLAG